MGLFASSLALGLMGLVIMLAFQFSHHIGGGHGDIGHHGADFGSHDLAAGHHGIEAGHHGLDVAHHGTTVAHDVSAGHADAGGAHHVDHAGTDHAHADQAGQGHDSSDVLQFLRFIPSPVMIFSWLIGFGIAGLIAQDYVEYAWAVTLALIGGTAFQKLIIRPFWNLIFSFESKPAALLEGSLAMKAIAVTAFDPKGCGIVRLVVDDQTRDVLARLVPGEHGEVVHKGDSLFVEMVNPSDNSVVVSKVRPLNDR